MSMTKHILIDSELLEFLEKNRAYKRETYNDIIKKLLKFEKKNLKGGY